MMAIWAQTAKVGFQLNQAFPDQSKLIFALFPMLAISLGAIAGLAIEKASVESKKETSISSPKKDSLENS